MRVAVTGAAGFVGSNLVAALLGTGEIDVVGIDSLTDSYDPKIKVRRIEKLTSPRFTFHATDLMTANLSDSLAGASVIFHLAGHPGVRTSWGRDFSTYTERNVLVTQRLLEFVREHPVDRLVYASSSSIYGNAGIYPVTEAALPRPFSPYGVTKLAAEHLCSLYAENYGVATVSLRYFTVYGPGQRPDMAFTRFIRALQDDEDITINGDGGQIRDFTYVGDVVRANIAAAFAPDSAVGRVFNICGGSAVTVTSVLDTLSEIAGRALRIRHCDEVAGDVRRTGGASDAAQTMLDGPPRPTFERDCARNGKQRRRKDGGSDQRHGLERCDHPIRGGRASRLSGSCASCRLFGTG